MAHWACSALNHAGQNGITARLLGPASRPRRPSFLELADAATLARSVITTATAAAVARPPAVSLGARGSEFDGESTGGARHLRRADGWGSERTEVAGQQEATVPYWCGGI
jgi:hypothetical protein